MFVSAICILTIAFQQVGEMPAQPNRRDRGSRTGGQEQPSSRSNSSAEARRSDNGGGGSTRTDATGTDAGRSDSGRGRRRSFDPSATGEQGRRERKDQPGSNPTTTGNSAGNGMDRMRMSRRADTKGASKTDRRRSMFNMPGGTTAGAGPSASSRNAFARPSSADGTVYDAKKGVINDPAGNFQNVPFTDVLKWLAGKMEVELKLDVKPSGSFTGQLTGLTPDRAFDRIHGVLLERGFYMLNINGFLIVKLLADGMPADFVPRFQEEDLPNLSDHLIISVRLPIHSHQAAAMKTDMEPLISPRGKIQTSNQGNFLIVIDRAEAIKRMVKILRTVDPPGEKLSAQTQSFRLKHVPVAEAIALLEEIIELATPQTPDPIAQLADFSKLGKDLSNQQFVESMLPGVSMKGVLADANAGIKIPTRLAMDTHTNTLFAVGEPNLLALIDATIKRMDVPEPTETSHATSVSRTYKVEPGKGIDLARSLSQMFADQTEVKFHGEQNFVVVAAPIGFHQKVLPLLKSVEKEAQEMAAIPTNGMNPEGIVNRLKKVFPENSTDSPTIVAGRDSGHVVVRGSKAQIEELRVLIEQLSR